MDIDTIKIFTDLFVNTAFPTALCCVLLWVVIKQNNEIKAYINENTKVLTELLTMLKNI